MDKQTLQNPHNGKKHIIIVGAGIIGACTAYFLTQHPKFGQKYHVTVLEATRVAGGASGKAGGLLALWAFPEQIVPLSFKLHKELAQKYDGENVWDYRQLTTVSVEGDIRDKIAAEEVGEVRSTKTAHDTKRPKSKSQPKSRNLPSDLDWVDRGCVSDWSLLGDTATTAQVHPYKFTNFMLQKAVESGRVEVIFGKATELLRSGDSGAVEGVKYVPQGATGESEPVVLPGDKVLVSAGPWTSKLLRDCPISGLRAHSITVEPENGKMVSPYAIFTELKKSKFGYVSPEIYARKDEVYVCGEGDTAVPVPESSDDVQVVEEKCDQLHKYSGMLSDALKNGRVLKRQACYLPVLDAPRSSGPLIGKTNVENLYLASGHSCWGINNAPATGKIMSELLMDGKVISADISALDPSKFFDAKV